MDGNLVAMLVCLGLYIGALGVASATEINLKFIAVLSVLAAFWFGFQWSSWLGILTVFGGIILGVFILKITVGNKNNG